MNDERAFEEAALKPQDGWQLACEGILRAQFGRRPSQALSKALDQLATGSGTYIPTEAEADMEVLQSAKLSSATPVSAGRGFSWPGRRVLAGTLLAAVVGGSLWWLVVADSAPLATVTRCQGTVTVRHKGAATSAAPGMGVRRNDQVETLVGAEIALQYAGEATALTLGDVAALTLADGRHGKSWRLAKGQMHVQVARQPKDKPLRVQAPQGEAEVAGAVFTLAARRTSTWLAVQEGVVVLTRTFPAEDAKSALKVEVGAGQFAVAAPGVDLTLHAQEEGVVQSLVPMRLPIANGVSTGDGSWYVTDGMFRQRIVSLSLWGSTPDSQPGAPGFPLSAYAFPFQSDASLEIHATAALDRELAEVDPAQERRGRWGLRVEDGSGVLEWMLTAAVADTRQVLAWSPAGPGSDGQTGILGAAPGPEFARAKFHLRLRVERTSSGGAALRGKIWQGRTEPGVWAVEATVPGLSRVERLGFETLHCGVTFSELKVWLIE